jgi:hypothetical protein
MRAPHPRRGAHYLKGEPAAPWITKGASLLAREEELKRRKQAK